MSQHSNPEPPSSTECRALVFGEALFDWFPDGRNVLGGAPFNVAWHLQGFGCNPLMIGRVGADAPGREIVDRMTAWGMDTSGMQTDSRYPTGRVSVKLTGGSPAFDIEPHQAYDYIDASEAGAVAAGADLGLLYHGTLAAREAVSAETLRALAGRLVVPRVCDVNLRNPWWTVDRAGWCLADAALVKLNDTELHTLTGEETASEAACETAARRLQQEHRIAQVVVTRGADGALWVGHRGRDIEARAAPPVPHLVDTVGAGDAFSAVVIVGMLRDWEPARALDRAVRFAADICGVPGATTGDVDLYQRHLDAWDHDA